MISYQLLTNHYVVLTLHMLVVILCTHVFSQFTGLLSGKCETEINNHAVITKYLKRWRQNSVGGMHLFARKCESWGSKDQVLKIAQ